MGRVNAGSSLASAFKEESLSVSFFSRKRVVAEATKVDMAALQHGILQLRNVTLKNVFPLVTPICNRESAELRTLHAAGTELKPKRQYYIECIILLMYWLFNVLVLGIRFILIKLKITYTLFVTYYYTRRLFTLVIFPQSVPQVTFCLKCV